MKNKTNKCSSCKNNPSVVGLCSTCFNKLYEKLIKVKLALVLESIPTAKALPLKTQKEIIDAFAFHITERNKRKEKHGFKNHAETIKKTI